MMELTRHLCAEQAVTAVHGD